MASAHTRRFIRSYTHELDASPEVVFPLLCPTREGDWVPGWEHTLVYSDSGFAEARCVFTTPGPGGAQAIWAVTHYDPEGGSIAFVVTVPGSHVEHLEVRARPIGQGRCRLTWDRVYTVLEEGAAASVARAAGVDFDAKMARLDQALRHHLRTGGCLDPSASG